jgi:hypothetical protein
MGKSGAPRERRPSDWPKTPPGFTGLAGLWDASPQEAQWYLDGHGDTLDAILGDDRRFFEKHPGRIFRFRFAWPFERLTHDASHTIVLQQAPGARWRMPLKLDLDNERAIAALNNDVNCEDLFFDLLRDMKKRKGKGKRFAKVLLDVFKQARGAGAKDNIEQQRARPFGGLTLPGFVVYSGTSPEVGADRIFRLSKGGEAQQNVER